MYHINSALSSAILRRGHATTDDFLRLKVMDGDLFIMWQGLSGDYFIETTLSDAEEIKTCARYCEQRIAAGDTVGVVTRDNRVLVLGYTTPI